MSVETTDKSKTDLWDKHLAAEFGSKNTEEVLSTMTDEPRVNIVALMAGANGRKELEGFYSNHFLNQLPPDIEAIPVSRTVGESRVVDEMILRFTHSIQMDWMLPGVPPTGKRIELAMVAVVQMQDGKIAHEHIYWDNATVLYQAGLLDSPTLPLVGAESARQVLDPSRPMNTLIRRAAEINGAR
ncbi:ester cyclase [Polyangium aurulentum]|uniref:ester cyclase n=1 Tax=Polyangium aurulentum TaxID=2567896 RepID=UPI001F2F4848|nr:ester cyclase [Polyangium aurulentum]